jgi:DNA-binding NtrC family response regulator
MEYEWPGNIRELQNIVERTLILNPNGPISFEHLIMPERGETSEQVEQAAESDNLDDIIVRHIRQVLVKTKGKIHGMGGAAELLGINPSTLRNRMNKLGIHYGRRSKPEVLPHQ